MVGRAVTVIWTWESVAQIVLAAGEVLAQARMKVVAVGSAQRREGVKPGIGVVPSRRKMPVIAVVLDGVGGRVGVGGAELAAVVVVWAKEEAARARRRMVFSMLIVVEVTF